MEEFFRLKNSKISLKMLQINCKLLKCTHVNNYYIGHTYSFLFMHINVCAHSRTGTYAHRHIHTLGVNK